MNVTVEYAAQVKKAAGIASESLDVAENSTAQDVVRQVAHTHGGGLEELILDGEDNLHPSILLFVGDDQVAWSLPVSLRDRDVVTILSPVSGG
ncbi:ThiS family protein [Symmachiella macrocystis]|uniref:ThiS family protein n=1 Tax=Symmachiella macrocystis TaxID=2527985 RepID=A0A5C6BDI9_9PLAN|nr:MoaD/ThiS family protein [Symmachiella macrocystis]TWU09677.1 ThiS family protein [Symmachiella macrocystis]